MRLTPATSLNRLKRHTKNLQKASMKATTARLTASMTRQKAHSSIRIYLQKHKSLNRKRIQRDFPSQNSHSLISTMQSFEAIQKGAMGTNISEYMKTWESWYKLQQKLDNGENCLQMKQRNMTPIRHSLKHGTTKSRHRSVTC